MKAPVNLIWNLIGDAFDNIFNDERRRPIEAVWQAMTDLAIDGTEYIDRYKNVKNIFKAKPFAYYGTMMVEPMEIGGMFSEGVLLGCRNGKVYIHTLSPLPRNGYIGYEDNSYLFTSSTTKALSTISGDMAILQSKTCPSDFTPSYFFSKDISSRWEDQGSEKVIAHNEYLEMNPRGINWCILHDKQYMDGSAPWSQIWRFKVNEWDNGGFKSISVNTFGDSGPKYEVRLESNDGKVFVKTGIQAIARKVDVVFEGATITRKSGNFIADGFRKGYEIEVRGTNSPHDGMYTIEEITGSTITFQGILPPGEYYNVTIEKSLDIESEVTEGIQEGDEIEIRMSYSNGQITSRVSVSGEVFIQNKSFQVSPGRRAQTFDFFNTVGDCSIFIDSVIVPYGKAESGTASSVRVSKHYPYVYQIEEPIVGCDYIRSEPWDINIGVEVLNKTDNEVEVLIDEDWNGYVPPHATLGSAVLSLNSSGTYTIIHDGEVDNVLKTWSDKFQWIKTSTFALSRRLHIEDGVWLIGAEGREVDLYGRNGRLVGLPKREDSQEYLDKIRGMQFGLLKPPTKTNMENGISILLGAPYTVSGGIIRSVEDDYVIVDNERIKYSKWWKPYLKKQGDRIPPMSPIVDAVNVYDWVSDHEEVKRVTSIWKSWGTVFVKIPDQLGASIQGLNDAINYINRTKNKRTDHIIEFEAGTDESDSTKIFDGFTLLESYTSTEEDLVFDDGESVVNNNPEVVSEDQADVLFELDDSGMLDEAKALDSRLTKFRAKVINIGNGWKEYIHRGDSGIHLKRDLTQSEIDAGFTKTTLRFGDSGGARPSDIVRVLNEDGTLWTDDE